MDNDKEKIYPNVEYIYPYPSLNTGGVVTGTLLLTPAVASSAGAMSTAMGINIFQPIDVQMPFMSKGIKVSGDQTVAREFGIKPFSFYSDESDLINASPLHYQCPGFRQPPMWRRRLPYYYDDVLYAMAGNGAAAGTPPAAGGADDAGSAGGGDNELKKKKEKLDIEMIKMLVGQLITQIRLELSGGVRVSEDIIIDLQRCIVRNPSYAGHAIEKIYDRFQKEGSQYNAEYSLHEIRSFFSAIAQMDAEGIHNLIAEHLWKIGFERREDANSRRVLIIAMSKEYPWNDRIKQLAIQSLCCPDEACYVFATEVLGAESLKGFRAAKQ